MRDQIPGSGCVGRILFWGLFTAVMLAVFLFGIAQGFLAGLGAGVVAFFGGIFLIAIVGYFVGFVVNLVRGY